MKVRPVTVALCLLLAAGIVAIAMLAPDTKEAKRQLAI